MGIHWSDDNQWWWDGQRWRPAAEYQPPGAPPPRPSIWNVHGGSRSGS